MAKGRQKKCEILVLNQIAQVGLKRFPAESYSVVKESNDPQAILVRSADLHKYEFGPSLRAVGRAGAGVNNIPVTALSKRGVPVFNAPGANANAVKELVIAGILIAFVAGVLVDVDAAISKWAAGNPFHAGPHSDWLACLPFAALVLFLYLVARGKLLATRAAT